MADIDNGQWIADRFMPVVSSAKITIRFALSRIFLENLKAGLFGQSGDFRVVDACCRLFMSELKK